MRRRRTVAGLVVGLALLAAGVDARERKPSDLEQAIEAVLIERLRVMACLDTWSPSEFVEAMAGSKPCHVVNEEGDPSFGTIHVIGQLHESVTPVSTTYRELLARYQLAILQRLLKENARVLFVEGCPADSALPAPNAAVDSILRASLEGIPGPEELLDHVDELQMLILQHSNIVQLAYRALRPGTEVLCADTSLAAEDLADRTTNDSLVFDVREHVAMATVGRYLERHPGAEVFLIFGAAHIFDAESVRPGFRVPHITSTTFPWLLGQMAGQQYLIVELLREDPAALRRYLGLVEGVTPETYASVDAEAQRICLARPFYLTEEVSTPRKLEAWLRRHARNADVRRLARDEHRYFER